MVTFYLHIGFFRGIVAFFYQHWVMCDSVSTLHFMCFLKLICGNINLIDCLNIM